MTTYKIFDNVGKFYLQRKYKTRKSANNRADKLNMVYGAHRFIVSVKFGEEI